METDKVDNITMIKDMNIYKKIQKVKLELSQRELKKSGENTFSKFKYYELGDFLPSIIELCDKYGLFTKIDFENEYTFSNTETETSKTKIGEVATLTIVNSDNPKEEQEYTSNVKELDLKGANAIQNYGGVQTYLRRYLYMNAFDIVEADMFDSQEFEKKKKKKAEKNDLTELVVSCKKAFTKASTETKTKVGDMMKTLGYSSFATLEEKQEKEDIVSLAKALKVAIPEGLSETKKEEKE